MRLLIAINWRFLSRIHDVGGIPKLSIIIYYSRDPVNNEVLAEVPISSIVVYCCNDYNTNFSTIVPIKSFECVNPMVQSCKVNAIKAPFNTNVFIAMILN